MNLSRMNRKMKRRLTWVADMTLLNAALLIAPVLYYVLTRLFGGDPGSGRIIFESYLLAFLSKFWILTVISSIVFYLSGFYTWGRIYRGRYKALVVAQAVTLSFIVFGFALVFVFRDTRDIPRGVLALAWLIAMVAIVGIRMMGTLWSTFIRAEGRRLAYNASNQPVRNVLVIGGGGYIGSSVVTQLLEKGYHIRLMDLMVFGTEPIAPILRHPNLEIMKADFMQTMKVVEAMRGMDAVIHLGAIVGDPACALDEELTIGVNLTATRMIAQVAKGCRVNRFIFASTCSVYGASDETLSEKSALNPVSLYARSKIASEKVLMRMADEHFAPVIVRFGTIYGLSGRTRFDLVVNLLSAKAIVDGQITVFGGDQWRPFVHVEDAATAVCRCLEAPLEVVRNEVFNVGSDEQNYTIQQIGEIIHALAPTAQLINMGQDSDRRNYRVDFTKIRRALKFNPKWTVEMGAHQVIDAIQSGQVQDYRAAKYSNVKYLNMHRAVHAAFNQNSETMDFLGEEDTSRLMVRANAEQALAYDMTVEGWSQALEQRSQQTKGHTLHLTELTLRLARVLGLSESEMIHLRRGVLLHDFGLIGIPDAILNKPGPLEENEWDMIRKHSAYAYEMLSPIAALRPALDIPHYHHERWDGTGYPRGLKGEEIPLAARIFAVADVWDALRSERPHRPAWPEEKVRDYIRENSGTHFDPRVAAAFLEAEAYVLGVPGATLPAPRPVGLTPVTLLAGAPAEPASAPMALKIPVPQM